MTYRLVHGLPEAAPCDPHIREYRHDCPARGGVSWPLRLKEHVRESPDYHACDCGAVCTPAAAHLVECDTCGPVPIVPAGRFTFTWVDGQCGCGLVVRSRTGRLAVA